MKNNKNFLPALVVAIVAISAINFLPLGRIQKVKSVSTTAPAKIFQVEQKIVFGNGLPEDSKTVEIKDGDTVLDVLMSTNSPEIKEYSFGKVVESINGKKNGDNKKYWLYSVNGQEATVGAGDYMLQENDKILWELK